MTSPRGLVRIDRQPDLESGVLVQSLNGFLDAGSAGRLAVAQMLADLDHEVIAEFDVDVLYDYRARRPRMTFLADHYGEIELPRLQVERVIDAAGRPFLVMHGPEPDFRWQAFAEDVVWLTRELGVELVIGIHAVPWPAPHTRPVNVTAHSNDPALVADRIPFVGDLEVPGHVAGMLEMALGAEGIPAMGFAAHVPHYLSAAEYPRASVALLEAVSAQTGLLLPLDALRTAAEENELEIGMQVAGETENVEAVHLLEQQYDDFMRRLTSQSDEVDMPDPEEFVDQVERFLADRERDERSD